MDIKKFDIDGPVELTPRRSEDDRGYFAETFNSETIKTAGISISAWVQDNQSYSVHQYTLRGLHFQLEPCAQAKLVRVLKGSIFDVAVDIRPDSRSFGKWVGTTLSAEKMNQLYVPAGFAHGFLTLEPGVEVFYKVSTLYSKLHDRALAWNDKALAIDWPMPRTAALHLSAKDAAAPRFAEIKDQL
jgi:dTDP-4-dehydrorhamnose 3,5-epimerase